MSGTATGIVVATGDSTVFGQIAKLTGEPKSGLTTIEKEIFRFVLLIFLIMISWIVILAAVWYVLDGLFHCHGIDTDRCLGEDGFERPIPTGSMYPLSLCLVSALPSPTSPKVFPSRRQPV